MMIKGILKRALAFVLAASSSLVLMTGCGKKTPIATIEIGAEKLADNISEDYSVINTLSDALSGGSVQINVPLDQVVRMLSGMDIKGIGAALTMYFGEGDMMLNAAATINGAVAADADLYVDKKGFAVTSDALLDSNTAYGSKFKGIDERFESSIFAGDGKYAEYAELLGNVADVLSYAGKAIALKDELDAWWTANKADIYTAIEENSDSRVESGAYSVGDKSVNTHFVSIVADKESFVKTLKALCNVLLLSQEFKDICTNYSELFELFGIPNLHKIVTELNKNAGDYSDDKLEIYAHVGKSSKELLSFEVKLSGKDFEATSFKFECAPSSKELKNVTVTYKTDSDSYLLEYKVTEDTDKAYKSRLDYKSAVSGVKTEQTLFTYSWNKTDGNFKLRLMDDTYTAKGTIAAEKEKSVIKVDSFDFMGFDLSGEIIINAVAEMRTIKKYKDILTVDEAEFEKVFKPLFDMIEESGLDI